ncbi:hypothetical protein [Gluconobacter cerinus]|uniref:t-SNARE coiled-coil homology domain-containing protein n=1 Tax=Gluconobacter cerinus TaxID=38307 RepID=A0AAV5NBT3_9PROT|nr:hypothetical protein [Gluconobacter cerinus]MBS1067238.1 hypothetical protein [Gluconobacter cerinus]GBR03067.1 hypothetical protein AA0229_1857 [Gluconobacter cerinus NRIC 0229]GLQ61535.1 hypothetical protein GCM10007867_03800 [Gluconobacter cerinus]
MADDDCATQGDIKELLERVVRLETQQEHGQETVQSLFDRVTRLETAVTDGFTRLSNQIADAGNRRAMFIAGGSGVGGGVAVGIYSLIHMLGHL